MENFWLFYFDVFDENEESIFCTQKKRGQGKRDT